MWANPLLRYGTGLGIPDLGRVLGDGAVAGELAGPGDVQDRPARPPGLVRVEFAESPIGIEIGSEVGQVHVVVALGQERTVQRRKDARLVAAEMVGGDQVQRGSSLQIVFVMPMRAVPAAAVGDLF